MRWRERHISVRHSRIITASLRGDPTARYGHPVPSRAHDTWTTVRRQRLEIASRHCAACLAGSHERTVAEWALAVHSAAEFQGYCRELHSLAVSELMSQIATQTLELEIVIRASLANRRLAKANADKESISQDFALIGLGAIWDLAASEEAKVTEWTAGLSKLLNVRNAIAHGDYKKLDTMVAKNESLLELCQDWNTNLDNLVQILDRIVSIWLQRFLGLQRTW
jgi:hypothetical protein